MYIACYILFPLVAIIGTRWNKAQSASEWLSKERTDGLRGIAILFIVLHHMTSGVVNDLPYTMPFVQMGFAGVAVFFLLSGYVHIDNYANKSINYHFLIKKAQRMLVPYILIWGIYFTGCGLTHTSPDSVAVLKDLIQFKLPETLCWYFRIQLLLYVMFYFSFGLVRGTKKDTKSKMRLMTSMCMVYILVACLANMEAYWYMTVGFFPIGMYLAYYKGKLFAWITEKRRVMLLFSVCACVFCAMQGLIFFRGFVIGYYPMHIMLMVAFVGISLAGLYFSDMGSPILRKIGSVSLELYLIHGMIISSSVFPRWDFTKSEDVVNFIALSIVLSFAVNKGTSILLPKRKKDKQGR